jgi:hypothetical protein
LSSWTCQILSSLVMLLLVLDALGRSAFAADTPFTGAPAVIPGTIQAANFDNGGEGVAYYDTTPGNAGGAYRSTDVDIQTSSEGGYNIGWIASTEWLNYTVNVAAAGTYSVQLRVASPTGGGLLHVGFNGPSAVWSTISVPDTGGWQNWTTIALTAMLGAGPQLMTLYVDTGGFNLESVTVNTTPPVVPAGTVPAFSHVYLIVMENQELSGIIGNPDAPYINSLASQNGLATGYTAVTHPSLPNYMSITGGNTYFTDDCEGCVVNVSNIADEMEAAGLPWKAYMEDMPGSCGTSDTVLYATKHNPFIHYVDIVSNLSRCQAHVVPLTTFYGDLSGGVVPTLAWITPNLCSDMHDCGVASGDAWLAAVVPQILDAPDFSTSVLFIVWDEGTTNTGGGGLVPLLVVSPLVAPGFQSAAPANHFSLLRTLEDAWGLPPLGQSSAARPLSEYFSR